MCPLSHDKVMPELCVSLCSRHRVGWQMVLCVHTQGIMSVMSGATIYDPYTTQHQWHHGHQKLFIYTSPRRAKNMKTPSLCSLRAMACNVWCPPLTTLIPRALATFLADCCSSLIPLSLSAAADNSRQFTNRLSIQISAGSKPSPSPAKVNAHSGLGCSAFNRNQLGVCFIQT